MVGGKKIQRGLLNILFISNTGNMTISSTHIPSRLKPCTFCWSEEELRKKLEMPEGSKHVDDYGHSVICTHFLIERKSDANITNALNQLEATFKAIKKKNLKLKEVIIICNRINKLSSGIYEAKTNLKMKFGGYSQKVLYDKRKNIPIYCCKDENYPILVEYTK